MCFTLHNEWCVVSEYKCVSVFIMICTYEETLSVTGGVFLSVKR